MRAFIALLFVAVASAELAPLLEHREPIPGKYIIKLKEDFDLDEIATTVRISGGKVGSIFRHVLYGFVAELSANVLDVVRRLPAVEYVEQEGVYRKQEVIRPLDFANSEYAWGLDRIDQRSVDRDGRYEPFASGSGYTVWVVDSGVRESHSEFEGRAYQVANFVSGENEDCDGHGTHCAGTVGSKSYGVAKNVRIYGVKVLNCFGSGSNGGIIDGLEYVAKYADGKSVASMSLGGFPSRSLDSAVEDLVTKAKVPTAVAAGNEEDNACNYSPSREPTAITVGATDWNDYRADFSNYGSCVDIYAPGDYIVSLGHNNDYETKTMSGTSMACPHVAGAIALYQLDTDNMLKYTTQGALHWLSSSCPNKLLYV